MTAKLKLCCSGLTLLFLKSGWMSLAGGSSCRDDEQEATPTQEQHVDSRCLKVAGGTQTRNLLPVSAIAVPWFYGTDFYRFGSVIRSRWSSRLDGF